MAKKGAQVTAIDISQELLENFSNQCVVDNCPNNNIRLLHGDITTMKSFGENFDLVLAIDLLPYNHLKSFSLQWKKLENV